MFILKSKHDRAMVARDNTEAGLLARISRLEMQVKNATDLAEMRGRALKRLESEIEHQSVNINSLYNTNRQLERQLAPFITRRKGAGGRFVSNKATAA